MEDTLEHEANTEAKQLSTDELDLHALLGLLRQLPYSKTYRQHSPLFWTGLECQYQWALLLRC